MPHRNRRLEEQEKIAKMVRVAKRYKLNMLQELRSKAWYKYQYYNPHDKRSDDFGFVHFESKQEMERYISERRSR